MKKTVKLLFFAIAAAMALTACSDNNPERIMWEVTATPSENVEAFASPDFHPSVLINASPGASEVTLKCTNYADIQLESDVDSDGFSDTDCGFTLARLSANEFKITFDEWQPAEPGKDYYRFVYFFTMADGTPVSSGMTINRIQ